MSKAVIPDDALDKLEAALKEYLHAKVISRSQAVMYMKSPKHFCSIKWIAVAMKKASLKASEYGVLLEAKTPSFFCAAEFVHYGDNRINEKLVEKFGGSTNNRFWTLHNEKGGMYGYRGDRIPTAKEIVQFLEKLHK